MRNVDYICMQKLMRSMYNYKKTLACLVIIISHFSFLISHSFAQFNTDRLVMIGRSALYYEDYVLSIQYFNQAISQKPWLYEPWFFRGVAKYYLDDFRGAESDCSEAIERNPYVVSAYEVRALCRINQKKFKDAISDYDRALRYDPENQLYWYNRILCLIQDKEYDQASTQIDSMITRWSRYARAYAVQGEVYLLKKDTVSAIKSLDKSLEIDPYDGGTWAERAIISLSRQEWKEGEEYLSQSIKLLPRHAGNYINRAMARYNQNNLRGAMTDYDTALDIDPNNFLGHYNRGLLRAQVGDDNRGIEDFDFVLKLEPNNLMALFNRALLLEQTGNLRAAIRDYSKVIEDFPNFWFGLEHRASCYRRLGNTKQAELDEFRILKAQMDKRYGKQTPRLSQRQMRRRSDEDLEKYNQLVIADEEEVEHEYKSAYRGRVQNRKADLAFLPMYGLTFTRPEDEVKTEMPYETTIEEFNATSRSRTVYVSNDQTKLDEARMHQTFVYIDSLSTAIDATKNTKDVKPLLFMRAIAYSTIQNFDNAIDDLSICIQIDSTLTLAYWQRAVCQAKINEFNASQGTNIDLQSANVMGDLSDAIRKSPRNAYLYYNRGNLYAQRNDYQHAIDDYTQAIALEERLAEAWYNRGLAKIFAKKTAEGVSDLSKAGELGLYQAYSVIKKYQP